MLLPSQMPDPAMTALGVVVVISLGLLFALRNQRRRNREIRRRFRDLEGEEQRMFSFLNDLGLAIENEPSTTVLSRIIVDGIDKVVNARGGAVYLLGAGNSFLLPSYISEDCPPLIGIPVEVRKKAERDSRALESHLRLSRVTVDEGILGYCLAVGEPIHVKDVKSHPSFRDAFTRYTDDVSALLSPLRHAGRDLGVLVVARRHLDGGFSQNDFTVFRSAAEQSSFAIGNARIHREAHEKRAMEGELQNAREVQRILLPQEDPVVPGFRISGTNVPARIISGDYYDYLDLGDGKFGIAIADVSGKGLPAGLLMAMCRSALRSVAPGRTSPSEVLAAVNRQLFPDIREDMFISMAYAILDQNSGRLVIARAGHDPALLFRGTRETSSSCAHQAWPLVWTVAPSSSGSPRIRKSNCWLVIVSCSTLTECARRWIPKRRSSAWSACPRSSAWRHPSEPRPCYPACRRSCANSLATARKWMTSPSLPLKRRSKGKGKSYVIT